MGQGAWNLPLPWRIQNKQTNPTTQGNLDVFVSVLTWSWASWFTFKPSLISGRRLPAAGFVELSECQESDSEPSFLPLDLPFSAWLLGQESFWGNAFPAGPSLLRQIKFMPLVALYLGTFLKSWNILGGNHSVQDTPKTPPCAQEFICVRLTSHKWGKKKELSSFQWNYGVFFAVKTLFTSHFFLLCHFWMGWMWQSYWEFHGAF